MPLSLKTKIIVAAIALTASLGAGTYMARRPKPVSIGGYRMPDVQGWERRASRTSNSSGAYYSKKSDDVRMSLQVRWDHNSRRLPPQSLQQIKKLVDSQRGTPKSTLFEGFKFKFAPSKIGKFAGFPAVVLNWTTTIPGKRVGEAQGIRFIDNGKYFELSGSIMHPANRKPSAAEKAELKAAWEEVEAAFKKKS